MKPYDIRSIFVQMEQDLIVSMKRNLALHEAEEAELGIKWDQWQKRKLLGIKRYKRENRELLKKNRAIINRETRKMLKESYHNGAVGVDSLIKRLGNRVRHLFTAGKLTEPITRVDDGSFFRVNEKRLNALIEAVTDDFNKGIASMLRMSDDVYRKTIFKAQVYHNAGAATLPKAIDMATKDFLDRGFNCITYRDGRTVDIAAYAEMALRAASQRATFEGEGARRAEWGIHTVVISSHVNCSPMCLPWQGRVYIDDVYSGGVSDGGYPLLSTAMRGGLFHPSCRHNKGTYLPGISSMPAQVSDARAAANYEAEQKQRYMERVIRKYKRRELGAVDESNQDAAAAKVKQWNERLSSHLADNDQLRRDRRRERITG